MQLAGDITPEPHLAAANETIKRNREKPLNFHITGDTTQI
jgi:hypothetical protein